VTDKVIPDDALWLDLPVVQHIPLQSAILFFNNDLHRNPALMPGYYEDLRRGRAQIRSRAPSQGCCAVGATK
jgi:hypothetical protein